MKKRVLIICEHNSARSQIAAAYLRKYGSDDYDVESAGLVPTELNPLAVAVMKEAGIDISDQKPQSVFGLFQQGKLYQTIITVCQPAADKCPIFPGVVKRLHWPFNDPAQFTGTWEQKLSQTRQVRDKIENAVKEWISENRIPE
jgi:arsenate reductase (thioredoxin)